MRFDELGDRRRLQRLLRGRDGLPVDVVRMWGPH